MKKNGWFRSFEVVLVVIFVLTLFTAAPHPAFAESSTTTSQDPTVKFDKGVGKLSPVIDPLIADYTALDATNATKVRTLAAISFVPADVAVSPEHDTICLVDNAGKRVCFADLSTGKMTPLTLPFTPQKVIFAGGNWLVTMSTPTVDSDKIAVIDPKTFTLSRIITIDMDITGGIAGDHDYLYTYGYSYGSLNVYNLKTGEKISSIMADGLRDLQVNPKNGILYGVCSEREGIASYQVSNGMISNLSEISDDCYSLTIMPDGKHLLSSDGNIFSSSADRGLDLALTTKIPGGGPTAADPINNELYVISERLIQVYDASNFKFKRVIPESAKTSYLLYSSSKLIIGQKNTSNALVFHDADVGSLLKTLKINGDAFSEFYPLHFAIDRGTVPHSMSSIKIEAAPAFANAVVSGDVGMHPLAVGKNTFVISVKNPVTGNKQTYTITMTRRASDPAEKTYNAFTNLGFTPVDGDVDPTHSVAYMTSTSGLLYRIDLKTGAIIKKKLDLPAESLTFANGKIYVSLLRAKHNANDDTSPNGYGAIAVVDAATFKVDSIFNTNIDPFDIAADNAGFVYLAPGSNQWSILASYNSVNGRPVSFVDSIRALSFLQRNPVTGKLYSVDTDLSPRQTMAYEVSSGVIKEVYGSPYHGDYQMSTNIEISTDGKYIFNFAGTIFHCSPNQTGDMVYARSIEPFNAICFDLRNNRFYTAEGKNLVAYAYNTFTVAYTKALPDYAIAFLQVKSNPIALYISNSGICYFRWINSATVTFNSQGGSKVGSASVLRNTTVIAPNPPARTGYTFAGWYKDAACTKPWNFNTDKVTTDITLYAKWAFNVPANPAAVSISSSSIRISWNAVAGAKGYEVWRATTMTGKYSRINTAAATYFLNKGLSTGKTYYYKVRAYTISGSKKIYSGYTKVVYAAPRKS